MITLAIMAFALLVDRHGLVATMVVSMTLVALGTPETRAKCVEIAKTEDMQARMKAISAALPIQAPAEIVAYRDADSTRNAELIKAANVKLE